MRRFHSEVIVEPFDDNGLPEVSAAQCQHLRSVSIQRLVATRGNVGAATLTHMRETIAVLLDLP